MKVLIITGELAYPLIKEVVSTSKEDIIVHIADNTQVAAFLTPRQIIKEVKTCFSDQLDDIDMILVPGLIKKGTKEITKELGIPTFKGSTDGADLAMVLNLIGSIDCKLLRADWARIYHVSSFRQARYANLNIFCAKA